MELGKNNVPRADSPSPSDKSDAEDDVREAIGAIRKGESTARWYTYIGVYIFIIVSTMR